MPVKVNMDILQQLGKPDAIVDETLDRLIQSAENKLGKKGHGVGNLFLALFENETYRVQLTEDEIVKAIRSRSQLSQHKITAVLEEFVKEGILHQLPSGHYELINNFVAKKANKKLEADKRLLVTMRNTIQDHQERDELLNRKFLNYLAPFLPQLELTAEERHFIKRSKRNENLKIWGLIALLIIIFTALSLMYYRAESNFKIAEKANEELAKEQDKTEKEKQRAEFAKTEADLARYEAEQARDVALVQQHIADSLRQESEMLRRLAEIDRDSLRELKIKEERLRIRAQKNAELNEELKKRAERHAENAKAKEAEALRNAEKIAALNRIIDAQIRAQKSLDIEDDLLRALEALEAYKVNKDNATIGDTKHPAIVKALYTVADNVFPDVSYSREENIGSVKNIVFQDDNTFFTSSASGVVQRWSVRDWNTIGVPELAKPQRINVAPQIIYNDIAVRNDTVLTGGEDPCLQLARISNGARSVYPQNCSLDEIYQVAFNGTNEYIAVGKSHVWFLEGNKVKTHKKKPSTTNFFVDNGDGTKTVVSVSGQYSYGAQGRHAYTLQSETFTKHIATVDTINIPGSQREIDYGSITAAQHLKRDDQSSLLVLGFSSGRVLVWEEARDGSFFGKEFVFKSHRAAIADIAFSHDKQMMSVASYDGTISVWELEQRQNPAYLPMVFELKENAWALSVAFSGNDNYVVAGDKNGELYFWNINPDDYAFEICDYVTSNYSSYSEQNSMNGGSDITLKGSKAEIRQAAMSQQKVREVNNRVHQIKIICQ